MVIRKHNLPEAIIEQVRDQPREQSAAAVETRVSIDFNQVKSVVFIEHEVVPK